ncbi:polysaccharide biosynthesis protein [Patescibacteria group bacterium]|nr:polysaccharide biosynthesis protein [Patescibacteria group bacterium]
MKNKIKIIIVGAGEAGSLISKNIYDDKNSPFELVGFVDDDLKKKEKKINGKKVLGELKNLKELIDEFSIKELLIAMPSGRGDVIRKVLDCTKDRRVRYKIIPRSTKVLIQDFGESYLKHIRDVSVEDLLGGEIVKSELKVIGKYLKNKCILITGAAGSIGSELARQVAAFSNAKKVILFDWSENGMFLLQNDIQGSYPNHPVEFVIGDIKDKQRLNYIFDTFSPDLVFHAAVYKHVPLISPGVLSPAACGVIY